MASGYLNSAGTDLDSLFYTNNGNAGALGFQVSGGQDLGDRYISGSLGYNVGYKNNAGTDIGYLRGNLVAPTGTATLTAYNKTAGYHTDTVEGDEESWDEYMGYGKARFNVAVTVSNGMPVTSISHTVQVKASASGIFDLSFNPNSTSIPNSSTGGSVDVADFGLTTSWKDVKTWEGVANSWNIGVYVCENGYDKSYSRPTWNMRIKTVISNSKGSTTLYTSEVTF